MARTVVGDPMGIHHRCPRWASASDRVVVDDLNADGHDDRIVVSLTSNDLQSLPGDGTGSFVLEVTMPVAIDPRGLLVGDLDGDPLPDIALTGRFSHDQIDLR